MREVWNVWVLLHPANAPPFTVAASLWAAHHPSLTPPPSPHSVTPRSSPHCDCCPLGCLYLPADCSNCGAGTCLVRRRGGHGDGEQGGSRERGNSWWGLPMWAGRCGIVADPHLSTQSQVCEGEVGAIVLVVALLTAAVVGLLAVLPYAYAWLYSAVRGGGGARRDARGGGGATGGATGHVALFRPAIPKQAGHA